MENLDNSFFLPAQEPGGTVAQCPDIYVVQPGDTYALIAEKLGVSVDALMALNPEVDPQDILIDQFLCIPLQSPGANFDPGAQDRPEASTTFAEMQIATEPPAAQETMAVAEPTLAAETLAVDESPVSTEEATEEAMMNIDSPSTRTCPSNYSRVTVPYGWDYGNILIRYGVSYEALQSANPGVNIAQIYPGLSICVPPPASTGAFAGGWGYTMRGNDSLDSVARRFNTTVNALLRANPAMAPQDFIAGRSISV